LLVESGFSAHERSLLAQLDAVLDPSTRLALLPPRLGEFDGVSNTRPIVDHRTVDVLYGPMLNSTRWVDFRPEHRPAGSPVGDGRMEEVEFRMLGNPDVIELGRDRRLDVFHPPLRLLVTHWIYDGATRTLFTSDAFTHMRRSDDRGPWVVDSTRDVISGQALRAHLLATKFWWLRGARTEPIRRGLAAIFEDRDVEVLAPSFGCILVGRAVVRQHYELLQTVLEELAQEPPIVGLPSAGCPPVAEE
ncbi:MAG: hypothetical protein LBJ87_00325, partial [bacterium]|nr:hypothetical protein [bacterium]